MEIQARVALALPNKFYKVELKYDTFEKATFDSYLIAALVKNTKKEKEVVAYIDEVTGNGSLNPHFKNLYKEISKLTNEQIEGILNDSLYPIIVVDRKNHFKYYELFDASRMNDRVYSGNLANNNDLANLLMPKDSQAKFHSMSFEVEDGIVKQDMYNAIFSEKGIKIDLDAGHYYPISKDNFLKVFDNDKIDPTQLPVVKKEIGYGTWNVLTNDIVKTWHGNNQMFYQNRDGNFVQLTSDFIKVIEVIDVFDLYFYKETKHDFSSKNKEHVRDALDYLMDSKNINTFKTKSLIAMLSVIEDIYAQQVVEWFLTRKNSKDVAEFGLTLIKHGLEKGWTRTTLTALKQFAQPNDYVYLYRIDKDMTFSVIDFLNIPDVELAEAHLAEKRAHLLKKSSMIDNIRLWVGEMLEIREKAKKLSKDNVTKSFNDFANEYIGHFKKTPYDEMTFEEVSKEYEKIRIMYNGNYQKIKARVEKHEV